MPVLLLKSLLTNKWTFILLIVVSLGAYIGYQELRYSEAMLTLQSTENSLSRASQELSDSLSDNTRLLEQVEASEKAIKSYQKTVSVLDSNMTELQKTLTVIGKEDKSVQEVYDTKLPSSVLDSLR